MGKKLFPRMRGDSNSISFFISFIHTSVQLISMDFDWLTTVIAVGILTFHTLNVVEQENEGEEEKKTEQKNKYS